MKKAFSLIELLIVIVIIGIIYTVSIGSFKSIKEQQTPLSLKNLKEYLFSIKHDKSVEFVCMDDCSACDIFVDGDKYNQEEIKNFLDKSVKIYRYDFNLGMIEKEYPNDVCFSISVDKKGVSEQIFVEYGGYVYNYTTYLRETPVYDSLQGAVDAQESLIREILR